MAVDGSGSGADGNPALCSGRPVQVHVRANASSVCEGACMQLYVSWYSTFGVRLGGYYAAQAGCVTGNYTFSYTPLVPALYRLDVV